MEMEDVAVWVAEVDARSKSNSHRIETLEKSTEVLNRLATSIEVMANKQECMVNSIDRMDEKITALEETPRKRWDAVVAAVITGLVGILLGAIVGNL